MFLGGGRGGGFPQLFRGSPQSVSVVLRALRDYPQQSSVVDVQEGKRHISFQVLSEGSKWRFSNSSRFESLEREVVSQKAAWFGRGFPQQVMNLPKKKYENVCRRERVRRFAESTPKVDLLQALNQSKRV